MEAFENDIFPDPGKRPITVIKPLEVLTTLRKLENRGVLDKLRKIRQACKQVFAYAIDTGRAEINPVADLASTLATPKPQHLHIVILLTPGVESSIGNGVLTAELTGRNSSFGLAENTDDLFVGKTLLHGDVLMWLMKTLLTSRCVNQWGAG